LSTRHPSIHEMRATRLVDSSFCAPHLPDAAGTRLCLGRTILQSIRVRFAGLRRMFKRNQRRDSSQANAETQPKLHPALLSRSAMISQRFIGTAAVY
jgi:hypothetical protein